MSPARTGAETVEGRNTNDILKYKDYFAEVHYSGDDDVFFGKYLLSMTW